MNTHENARLAPKGREAEPRMEAALSSGDRDQKRDPAGHIKSFNFPLQRVLGLEIDAGLVDGGSNPIERLLSLETIAHGQFEQACLSGSARVALVSGALHASLEGISTAPPNCGNRHVPYCGEAARYSTAPERCWRLASD